TLRANDTRHVGTANPRRGFNQCVEHFLQVVGRSADDAKDVCRRRMLLRRLGQLAGEPSDIGLLASSGRTTTAHRLRRNATLQLSRLAASRLDWFAACFG